MLKNKVTKIKIFAYPLSALKQLQHVNQIFFFVVSFVLVLGRFKAAEFLIPLSRKSKIQKVCSDFEELEKYACLFFSVVMKRTLKKDNISKSLDP